MLLNCKRINCLLIYRNTCKYLHCSSVLYIRKPTSTKRVIDFYPTSQESTVSGIFQIPERVSDINANFYGIESDEGVIHVDETATSDKLIQDSMTNFQQPKGEFRSVSFGAIRLDSENKPDYYARYSDLEDNIANQRKLKQKLHSKPDNNQNTLEHNIENQTETTKAIIKEIDEKYKYENTGHSSNENIRSESNFDGTEMKNSISDRLKSKELSSSYIDEFYFPEEIAKDSKIRNENNNFIDEQYFVKSELDSNVCRDKFVQNKDDVDYPDKSIQKKTVLNNSENNNGKKYSFSENIRNIVAKHEQNSLDQAQASSKNISDFQNVLKYKDDSDNYIDGHYFNEEIVENFIPQNEKINPDYIEQQYFNEEEQFHNVGSYVSDKSDMSHKFNDNFESHNVRSIPQENLKKITNQFISSSVDEKLVPDFIKSNTFNTSGMSQNKFQKNKFAFVSNFSSDKDSNVIPSNLFQHKSDSEGKDQFHDQTKSLSKSQKTKDSKKNINSMSELQNSTDKNEPETAYDFVKKLREKEIMSDLVKKGISVKKEKKLDSKGFRILKHQVPSLMYFTRDEMLELLEKSILYSDDDIVVLNKPYNLIIHESKTTKDNACLSNYLDDLAKLLDKSNKTPELFTVHRLDKETTGCLLLARNELAAQRLKSLFSQRKIMKTYWIVTSNVPDPMEGVIDIPISEGKVEKKSRMVLHPDLPKDVPYVNHSKCGKRAVTAYSVIATSGNAALVEVKPETGIKHQIRVHFGFGLECPILGDHKYSHLDKLVPQKLPSDLLQKLRVRQSKVRHIPLHIHSKHIMIPQYSQERNLFVTAPLPKHMAENLRSLKFKKK